MTAPPWLAPALSSVVLVYYAFALWWFLRREPVSVLLGLLAVAGLSLTLRLIYLGDYPSGFNSDEPLILGQGIQHLRSGYLFNEASVGHNLFLTTLFQAPLATVVGPFWAIRFYSLVTSVLCVPLAYATARALGLRATAGMAAAVLVAVLPWSLFWGRISVGGELTFHQLLMLAPLCRMMFGTASAVDAVIGGVGLGLLLNDYPVGRCLLPLPLGAALLARGRRLHCLAVLAIGVLCWTPYLYPSGGTWPLKQVTLKHDATLVANPVWGVMAKAGMAVESLLRPVAKNGFLTVASAGMHPPVVLALAFLGSLLGFRRGAFLWGGFLLSLTPTVLASDQVTAHRMMMAYPFIVLAAASALNGVERFRPPLWLTAVVIGVVSIQSVRLYFSDRFWLPEVRGTFDPDQTRLLEALPRDHKVIAGNLEVLINLWGFSGGTFEPLTTANWLAKEEKVTYAFARIYEPLEPAYRQVLGDQRVRSLGHSFVATLEPADSARLSTHGWAYRGRCGVEETTANVPFLHLGFCPPARKCDQPTEHEWSAVWNGRRSTLQLRTPGNAALVKTHKTYSGTDSITFPVKKGDRVTVSVTTGSTLILFLYVLDKDGERIPAWEELTPALATDEGEGGGSEETVRTTLKE